jgi:hypothetical protein
MSSRHHIKVFLLPIGAEHFLIRPSTVITKLKTERGLALQDLLTGAYEYIETLDFKPHARIYLLDYLAIVE